MVRWTITCRLPSESHQIAAVVDVVIAALLGKGELPPAGAVIGAGASSVCDECSRKREEKSIKAFTRIQHVRRTRPCACSKQGILCSGSATRGGLQGPFVPLRASRASAATPNPGALRYGSRLMSAVGSVIDSRDPAGSIEFSKVSRTRREVSIALISPGRCSEPASKRLGVDHDTNHH